MWMSSYISIGGGAQGDAADQSATASTALLLLLLSTAALLLCHMDLLCYSPVPLPVFALYLLPYGSITNPRQN